MKSASMPSLRVDPDLRAAAESVLQEGETLSSFMEQSLRDLVSRRQSQQEFIARGLAARDESRKTGKYFDADSVHADLRGMLASAAASKASASKAKR